MAMLNNQMVLVQSTLLFVGLLLKVQIVVVYYCRSLLIIIDWLIIYTSLSISCLIIYGCCNYLQLVAWAHILGIDIARRWLVALGCICASPRRTTCILCDPHSKNYTI